MIELDELQLLNPQEQLAEIKHTNRLFLKLLYNLSKYPHSRTAKKFVRLGLFEFETSIFADRDEQERMSSQKLKTRIKK